MSTASSKPGAVKGAGVVPWNSWTGLVYVIVLFFLSQFLGGLLLIAYGFLMGWSSGRIDNWLSSSVSGQFAYVLIAEGMLVGGIYLFLKHYKLNFPAIGLKKPRWSDPLYGLAALPAYLIIYILAITIIKHLVPGLNLNQNQQIGFSSVTGPAETIMAFIALVVLPPLAEEIMVRGFLYSSLKKALRPLLAVVITSLLFAAAHLPEGGSAGPLYVGAIDTFILSLFLIYLREKTGSLWGSITLHGLKNAIAFIALFGLNLK